MKPTVAIAGTGNLAWNLWKQLSSNGYTVVSVITRNPNSILSREFTLPLLGWDEVENITADVIFLCVPDSEIEVLADKLKHLNTIVVHCSGATDLASLNRCKERAVFYPLQSFTRNKKTDWTDIPILVEASSPAALDIIIDIAANVSTHVVHAKSSQRFVYHLAAVFASNFTNSLYGAAFELLEKRGFDTSLLQPLLVESFEKFLELGPEKAQTGPAKRGDDTTIRKHTEFLEQDKELLNIYNLLSAYIAKKYK